MPAKMLKQEFTSYLYSTEYMVRIESCVESVFLETYILIEDGSIDNCIYCSGSLTRLNIIILCNFAANCKIAKY